MNASRLRALLLLALLFAAGVAAGLAWERRGSEASAEPQTGSAEAQAQAEEAASEGRREQRTTIEEFADDLGLTTEQRGRIEGFLDHYRTSARALQRAVRPQYRALMDSVRAEIESVLTPTQVEQYRALLEQRYGGGRDRGERNGSQGERGDDGRRRDG